MLSIYDAFPSTISTSILCCPIWSTAWVWKISFNSIRNMRLEDGLTERRRLKTRMVSIIFRMDKIDILKAQPFIYERIPRTSAFNLTDPVKSWFRSESSNIFNMKYCYRYSACSFVGKQTKWVKGCFLLFASGRGKMIKEKQYNENREQSRPWTLTKRTARYYAYDSWLITFVWNSPFFLCVDSLLCAHPVILTLNGYSV